MPGLYGCCMHTCLAHHVLCRTCLHWGGTLAVFMTCDSPRRCGHCRGRSMWWVTSTVNVNAYNGINRWNLLPCGSPYCSILWIGRTTSGLHPCCWQPGGTWFVSSCWTVCEYFWINKWCKIRAGSDLLNVRTMNEPTDKISIQLIMWGLLRLTPIIGWSWNTWPAGSIAGPVLICVVCKYEISHALDWPFLSQCSTPNFLLCERVV